MDTSSGSFLDEHFGNEGLFDGEDNAVGTAEAESGAGIFDGFVGVFDLEDAAVGGEGGGGEVVA